MLKVSETFSESSIDDYTVLVTKSTSRKPGQRPNCENNLFRL